MAEFVRDEILETEEMRKVYVRRIPKYVTDEELKAFFETYGVVTNISARSKDVAFVTFEESETIDQLMLKKHNLKLNGRSVDVTWAVPKNKKGWTDVNRKDVALICTPTLGLSENDLLRYFEARHKIQYGRIEGIAVKNDSAEIIVSSADMADKMCIQHASFQFGGNCMELKRKKCRIAKAFRKRAMKRKSGAEKIAVLMVSTPFFVRITLVRITNLIYFG
jgi:RNA recognition motif-containing protein